MKEQRGADRAQPLCAFLEFVAAACADREVEAAAEELALAARQPCREILGVFGRCGHGRIGQTAALGLEPPRRFKPRPLPAQPVGRERRRDRFDVQGDVGVAGGVQERREPAAAHFVRVAGDGEACAPTLADPHAVAFERERWRPQERSALCRGRGGGST